MDLTMSQKYTFSRNASTSGSLSLSEELGLEGSRLELFNISSDKVDSKTFAKELVTINVVVYRDIWRPNITFGPGGDCDLYSNVPEKWEKNGFSAK